MSATQSYTGDNPTGVQRRLAMQSVKRRDTSPELALRKALKELGVRGYRIDRSGLPGRPDLAFGRQRLAIFVDGGFWHGRPDRVRPGRSPYWDEKIRKNRERDRRVNEELTSAGWRVIRLWDDEVLKGPHEIARRIHRRLNPVPVAEFFAGIGLVRAAIEDCGFEVAFANDISPTKRALYERNFDASDYSVDDVRNVRGAELPSVGLATASFPCTDLSLAGWRRGLGGEQSGLLWEFIRVLHEMGGERPRTIMMENVPSFASSNDGRDLYEALATLNQLGYWCDLVQLDARRWVPQSRPRIFVVGSIEKLPSASDWRVTEVRPKWIRDFVLRYPNLMMQAMPLPVPPTSNSTLADVVERIRLTAPAWWDASRTKNFVSSLSTIQRDRVNHLMNAPRLSWRTAYRRTRNGSATWEIRADAISGCLRTSRGGSSRQAVVEAGRNNLRVRWMNAREYARLMGAPNFQLDGVTENQALFGLGDAVCVPAVAWLCREYVAPLAHGELQEADSIAHTKG